MGKPITVGPEFGGNLFSPAYVEDNGHANYVIKRNWRRVLTDEVRDVGYDYFWPATASPFGSDPGNQPFPLAVAVDAGPINLIHSAERPNGQIATIVGTPTGLFRFIAMEGTDVAESDYAVSTLFTSNPGEWIKIASFSATSAKRWEAVNINGFTLFSNGVDLPCSYRVEDLTATPIYDLREQGYSSVGTLAAYMDMFMVGDVTELTTTSYDQTLRPDGRWPSDLMVASQSGGTVTAADFFFVAADVGKTIVWGNGDETKITAMAGASLTPPSGTTRWKGATVATALTKTSQIFEMRVKCSQVGSTYSGTTTGSITVGTPTLTATTAFFTAAMIGRRIRFANGWSTHPAAPATYLTILAVGGAIFPGPYPEATLSANAPETLTGLPFWVIDPATDFVVVAENPFWDATMIGQTLSWDNGATRKIVGYNAGAPTQVTVDSDLTVGLGFAVVDRPETYGRVTSALRNRIQYRVAWSALQEPRKFGPTYRASITAGSRLLVFKYPYKSLESGIELTIDGAGINGGSKTATAVFIAGNRIALLDSVAETAVSDAAVVRSEMTGSTAGFTDPPGDFGAILRMLDLQGTLIIYKDTSFVLGAYTGDPAAPFAWRSRATQGDQVLHYRYTLVNLGDHHIYAGRSSFYRFDLGAQQAVILLPGEMCKSIFFNDAKLVNQEQIFAADNPITKEAWFFIYGATGGDTALCYDYFNGVFRTSDVAAVAAGAVKRPQAGVVTGATTTWFLLGLSNKTLVVYGKSDEPVESWSNAKEIFYRRSATPFTTNKTGYESRLKSCMSSFGWNHGDKQLTQYVVHPGAGCPIAAMVQVSMYAARNSSDTATKILDVVLLDAPTAKNNISLGYMAQCFQDELIIPATYSGSELLNKSFMLRARTFELSPIGSKSYQRIKT